MTLFEKHQPLITRAIEALHNRTFYSAYPENPLPAIYGEAADSEGQAKFKALLGTNFNELKQPTAQHWIGQEESPYLREPLKIMYPAFTVSALVENANKALATWRTTPVNDRAGILVESLERMKQRFFEIAYATMHTTGQGYMMAFQASGPHAADRALEAIAAGYEELTRFPQEVKWEKPMGKYSLHLQKTWRAVPKGVSLVIGCSTFPTWNSVTGIYASLLTGNSVIVKPHPGAVLPIAIVVAEIQKVLAENNLDATTCQLAVDTYENPITKELAEHASVKLIDYTGNSVFGDYLESLRGKTVFTEKSGVNSVILDSTRDVDKMAANIAFSICLYSGQMCTAPQNIFIPETGITTPTGVLTFDEVAQKLVDHTNGLIDNPKAGPFVLGAIQNKKTVSRIQEVESLQEKIWMKSRSIENPVFKNALIATPAIAELAASRKEVFSKELFGPIVFLIKTRDTDHSIQLAQEIATQHGAISCAAYTTDPSVKEKIAESMALATTPVSFNLTGGIYMNQNAAFSDFHVTGGNPSGNASFTNSEYVVKRFTWVGNREPVTG